MLVGGQDRLLQGDDPGGPHQPPDRRAPEGRPEPDRRDRRRAAGRHAAARDLHRRSAAPRARPSSTTCRREAAQADGAGCGRSARRTCRSSRWEEASSWPRSWRRRRAATTSASGWRRCSSTGCGRTCACSPTRPSSTGCSAARCLEPADPEERDRAEDRAQHLPDRRPAADADLQPGPRRDRGRAQSGRHQGALLRRRRHRRPRLRRDAQGPQRQRPEVARASRRRSRPRPGARARPPRDTPTTADGAADAAAAQDAGRRPQRAAPKRRPPRRPRSRPEQQGAAAKAKADAARAARRVRRCLVAPRRLPLHSLRVMLRRSAAATAAARLDVPAHRLRAPCRSAAMTIKSMTGFARADGVVGVDRLALGGALGQRPRPRPPAAPAAGLRGPGAARPRGGRQARRARQPHRQPQRQAQRGRHRRSGSTRRRCAQVLAALDSLQDADRASAPPRAEALLGIKGVLEVVEPEESEAELQARTEAMLASLDEALDGMVRARAGRRAPARGDRARPARRHRAAGRS